MSSLYQKYRPTSFDDIVGQDAVVTILRNSILLDKVSHGYFFQGPRGTGKTSAARIFARAINCEQLDGANICDSCTPCLKGHLDLIEIDGGSTRGIEDIKKLQEELRYRPRYCSKKVVIIDECHQLTTDGINALLKIAEEPPKHVIFILCTTDPLIASETKHAQALLTLISRLMVLSFKAHSIESISKKLFQIYENETGSLPESQDIQDGLNLMARRAKGSLRDAENFLEIFLTAYHDTYQDLSPVAMDWLFPPEEEKALQLIEKLCEVNPLSAMPMVDELWEYGMSMEGVVSYVLEFLSDILRLEVGVEIQRPKKLLDRLQVLADIIQPHLLTHMMRCMGEVKRSDDYSDLKLAVINISTMPLMVEAPIEQTDYTIREEPVVEEIQQAPPLRW